MGNVAAVAVEVLLKWKEGKEHGVKGSASCCGAGRTFSNWVLRLRFGALFGVSERWRFGGLEWSDTYFFDGKMAKTRPQQLPRMGGLTLVMKNSLWMIG